MSEDKYAEIAKGLGETAEKVFDFVEKIIAGPIMEGTGIFIDRVKYWRFKNQINILSKAREYLKARGIKTPKKIPVKDLTTLLEYASFEEEEIMEDSWARLLANTMDPSNQFNTCHIFSQILNQLSINEIYILRFIITRCFIQSSEHRPYFKKHELIKEGQTDYSTGLLLIDNLLRLRLIEEQPPKLSEESKSVYLFNEDEEERKNEIIASDCYRISKFGVELVRQITL
jgi:hypothetical protein